MNQKAKFHNAVLPPKAVFVPSTTVFRNETDVPAVPRREQCDVRIIGNRGVAKRLKRNEGIILRMKNQRRPADAVDELEGAGALVIINGAFVSAMNGCESFVKVADGSHHVKIADVIKVRMEFSFGVHAAVKTVDESFLVEPVRAVLNPVGARA